MLETYAVEISIDWSQWLNYAQTRNPKLYTELSEDLNSIKANVAPTRIVNTFITTVTHSLAHVFLNFHSLYTGG
jgi:hypothetical protein